MLKCDPRAFAQCPGHQYCGSCAAEVGFMEGSECDKFNQSILSKPMTNADRIRAMSDEELAKVPAKFGYSCVFPQKECSESDACEKCLLEWLKQPAVQATNDRCATCGVKMDGGNDA